MFLLAIDGKGGDLERSLSLWGGLKLLEIQVIYFKRCNVDSYFKKRHLESNYI